MKPIDLLSFAEYSQKIPSNHLAPKIKEKSLTLEFLASHLVDFAMAVFMAAAMSSVYNEYMKVFINTNGLKQIYSQGFIVGLGIPVIPLMMFSYFFFSYFFNEGQTYGMNLMGIRMRVKSLSFRESFMMASHSTLLCFSGGLSFYLVPSFPKYVQTHDYLYHDLFNVEEKDKIDLFSMLETEQETIHQRAA